MVKPRKCLGWPVGKKCENIPGTLWSRHWCGPCNQQRLEYISKSLKQIQAGLKSSAEGKDGGR